MASEHAVADISSESFPTYKSALADTYIEGYDPVSLGAPHSSLNRFSTWIAMALILASLSGFGFAVWGGSAMIAGFGAQENDYSQILLILGLIVVAATLILGAVLIAVGRKDYKAYSKATGRMN